MRAQKIKMGLPAALLLLAGGCIDNPLDLNNPNERTIQSFWETESDAIAAMDGVYRTTGNDGLWGRNGYWIWARTDTYLSRSPAGALQNLTRGVITNLAFTSYGLGGIWDDPWKGVFRANQVVNRVPEMEIASGLKEQLVAEARFIRGLYHFEQALRFGDVPILTEPVDLTTQPEFHPRDQVWDQAIEDALAAAEVLPWSWSGDDVGRVTKGGALALAAEGHMMKQEWNAAIPLLQRIVNEGPYVLLPDYCDLFRVPEGENSAESLFEVQFGDVEAHRLGARGNTNPRLVSPSSGLGSSIGFNDTQPTEWGFMQFFAEPGRSYPDNPDPRLDCTIFWNKPGGMDVFGMPFAERYATTGPGGGGGFRETDLDHTFFWKKYQEYWRTHLTDFFNPINLKVYRYGMILLMLAEAQTEVGNVGAAQLHLNTLRARVGLPSVPGNLSQIEMEDWINREYILETMWEGNTRLKYLVRQGLLNKAYLSDKNPFHASLFVDGKHNLLPIPQFEIDRNPNAKQNPGW